MTILKKFYHSSKQFEHPIYYNYFDDLNEIILTFVSLVKFLDILAIYY